MLPHSDALPEPPRPAGSGGPDKALQRPKSGETTLTALPPSAMTADERLDEVASILAAGFRRLRAKKQDIKSLETQRIFWTETGDRSGHGNGETHSGRKKP